MLVLGAALAAALYWAESHPRRELAEGQLEGGAAPSGRAPSVATQAATSTRRPQPTAAAVPATATPSGSSPPSPPREPAAAPSDLAEQAFVTLSAAPWAEVRVDNRNLGVTPHRRVPLRAGKHVLSFSCPPLGKQARVPLDVKPNQALQVQVDLHRDPPEVTIR
jgi:hypothetical protein